MLLSDEAIAAKLAKRSPFFASFRRRETLMALDALGPAPTNLSVSHLEKHHGRDDALSFAVYNAERLKNICSKHLGVRSADTIINDTLSLSAALRGRVSVGRMDLEEAVKLSPRDRKLVETAMSKKRKAYALADHVRMRPQFRGGPTALAF